MFGPTHVSSGMALAHMGLLGYILYVDKDGVELQNDIISPTFEQTLSAMSVIEYVAVFITWLLFSFLLLHVGLKRITSRGKIRLMYIVGIVVGLGVTMFLDKTTSDVAILNKIGLCMIFGLLFPDIDSVESQLGRHVRFVGEKIITHRGLTHTIWVVLLLFGLSYYISSVYLLFFTLGYTLHIIQDSFNKQGVAWFYPLIGGYKQLNGGGMVKKGRKTKLAYTTGGYFEYGLLYVSLGVHVACFGYIVYILL